MSMDNTVQVFDDMLLREIKGYLRDDRDIVIFGCGQIGEMTMNLIKEDMEIFKKLCESCEKKYFMTNQEESYFVSLNDKNQSMEYLVEYDFSSPVEFMQYLNDVWENAENEEMRKFVRVIAAWGFKYKNIEDGQQVGVSPYIYEF